MSFYDFGSRVSSVWNAFIRKVARLSLKVYLINSCECLNTLACIVWPNDQSTTYCFYNLNRLLLDPSLITYIKQGCLLLFLLWWQISHLPPLSPNIDSLGTQQQAEEWQTCFQTNARGLTEATKLCLFENFGKLTITEMTNTFYSFTIWFALFVLIIYTSVIPVLLLIHSLSADNLGLDWSTHPN